MHTVQTPKSKKIRHFEKPVCRTYYWGRRWRDNGWTSSIIWVFWITTFKQQDLTGISRFNYGCDFNTESITVFYVFWPNSINLLLCRQIARIVPLSVVFILFQQYCIAAEITALQLFPTPNSWRTGVTKYFSINQSSRDTQASLTKVHLQQLITNKYSSTWPSQTNFFNS